MKYFYIGVITQYDGYEYVERAVARGRSVDTVTRKAEKFDFTHDNGIEIQEIDRVDEITKAEYDVLAKYLVHI